MARLSNPATISLPTRLTSCAALLLTLFAISCSDDDRIVPPSVPGREWRVELEYTSYSNFSGKPGGFGSESFLIALEYRGHRHGQRVVRYRNGTWQPFTDELPSITGISATAPDDIYASSNFGSAYRFDGKKWIALPGDLENLNRLEGVWARARNDVYFVGWYPEGEIYHFDGERISNINPFEITQYLRDVWGSGDAVFAIGDLGTILHFDGSQWKLSTESSDDLYDVWGTDADNVYAVGRGSVLHFDGQTWVPVVTSATEYFMGVWGRSSDDVYVVGSDPGIGEGTGIIRHFDGATWTEVYRDPNDVYLGSVYSLPGLPVLVGGSGMMLESSATGWKMTQRTTDETLQSIWVSPSNEVFVSGSFSEIFHYDGSSWNRVRTGTYPKHLSMTRGFESGNVYAVGQDGTIVRYDGSNWETMPGPTTDWFTDIWELSDSGTLLLSGDHGLIARYDGIQWTIDRQSPAELAGETMGHLWVFAEDNIYGVRNVWNSEEISTHVLHFDGSTWEEIPFEMPGHQALYSTWGSPEGELFVCSGSWAGKFDGSTWTELPFDHKQGVDSIWGRSSTDVYFSATQGVVYHYDGRAMRPMSTGVIENLTSIWGRSDGDVFAVSSSGTIVRYAKR